MLWLLWCLFLAFISAAVCVWVLQFLTRPPQKQPTTTSGGTTSPSEPQQQQQPHAVIDNSNKHSNMQAAPSPSSLTLEQVLACIDKLLVWSEDPQLNVMRRAVARHIVEKANRDRTLGSTINMNAAHYQEEGGPAGIVAQKALKAVYGPSATVKKGAAMKDCYFITMLQHAYGVKDRTVVTLSIDLVLQHAAACLGLAVNAAAASSSGGVAASGGASSSSGASAARQQQPASATAPAAASVAARVVPRVVPRPAAATAAGAGASSSATSTSGLRRQATAATGGICSTTATAATAAASGFATTGRSSSSSHSGATGSKLPLQSLHLLQLPGSLSGLQDVTQQQCEAAEVVLVDEACCSGAAADNSQPMLRLQAHLGATNLCALDLEFAQALPGQRQGSSWGSQGRVDVLALMQLCVPAVQSTDVSYPARIYIVEVPQLQSEAEQLLGLFTDALESPNITKVMHDAREDSRVLQQQFGITLDGVLDTQVLAGLATMAAAVPTAAKTATGCSNTSGGSSSSMPAQGGGDMGAGSSSGGGATATTTAAAAGSSSSLSGPVSDRLYDLNRVGLGRLYEAYGCPHPRKATVGKSFDANPRLWFQRPLPNDALQYAADDVRYLLPIAHSLLQKLPALSLRFSTLNMQLAHRGPLHLQEQLVPGYAPLLHRERGGGLLHNSVRAAAGGGGVGALGGLSGQGSREQQQQQQLEGLTDIWFEMQLDASTAPGWFLSDYSLYMNEGEEAKGEAAMAEGAGVAAAGTSEGEATAGAAQESGGSSSSLRGSVAAATEGCDEAVSSMMRLLPNRLRPHLEPYLDPSHKPSLIEVVLYKNRNVELRLSDGNSTLLDHCPSNVTRALQVLAVAKQQWALQGAESAGDSSDEGSDCDDNGDDERQQQQRGLQVLQATRPRTPAVGGGGGGGSTSSGGGMQRHTSMLSTNSSSTASLLRTEQDGLTTIDNMFGSDERLGIPSTLHRISAIRNRTRDIIGLTYRVGRHVSGVADLIGDVLSAMRASLQGATSRPLSLLILGRPGVGKSTLLRDIAARLSLTPAQGGLGRNVIIVDTSNEIAGDADEMHPCVGNARRLMVPRREQQAEILVQAVQNHAPQVIIIDEIGTAEEVDAAKTMAPRGALLIGTAHGNNLGDILANSVLNPLVGGIREVTLGDVEAKASNSGQKTRRERGGRAAFVALLELHSRDSWRLHMDVERSVDAMLAGPHTSSSSSSRDAGPQQQHNRQHNHRQQQQQEPSPPSLDTQLRSRDASGRLMVRFETPGAARQTLQAAAAVRAAAGVSLVSPAEGDGDADGREPTGAACDSYAAAVAAGGDCGGSGGFKGGWFVDLFHAGVHNAIEFAAGIAGRGGR